MMKINVTWLKSSGLKPNVLGTYLAREVTKFLDSSLYAVEEGDRWTLTFNVPDLGMALFVSGETIDTIRGLSHPFSPHGPTEAIREFAGGTDEYDTVTQNLTNLLGFMDIKQAEIEKSKRECRDLKRNIKEIADVIKGTRSDRLSPIVGGKLRDARLRLEQLTK